MKPFFNTGLTESEFIQQYWQKKPLLIRQAFPHFESPISPAELAGLACEPEIESRLIQEQGDIPWQVKSGPLSDDDFAQLPATHWTLLVQDVDKHAAELGIQHVFDPLSFIPQWRQDDVMVSYAVDQGSVGPHTDNYDVFLLQGLGQRHWQIQDAPIQQARLLPDLSLQILAEFTPDKSWTLSPGDMLYLPPGIAHHGVAAGECMTFSLGFRAPSRLDLLDTLVNGLAEKNLGSTRYQDSDLVCSMTDPAEINDEVAATVKQMLHDAVEEAAPYLKTWIGQHQTEPKSTLRALMPAPSNESVNKAQLTAQFSQNQILTKNPYYRFAWAKTEKGGQLFVAGEVYDVIGDAAALLPMLADITEITARDWDELAAHDDMIALIINLINEGAFYWA